MRHCDYAHYNGTILHYGTHPTIGKDSIPGNYCALMGRTLLEAQLKLVSHLSCWSCFDVCGSLWLYGIDLCNTVSSNLTVRFSRSSYFESATDSKNVALNGLVGKNVCVPSFWF